MEYSARTVEIGPGDLLLAFTDGASEARSPSGALWGEQSLLRLLESAPQSAGAALQEVVAAVRAHEAGTEPGDDLTLLAVRHLPR